jgi:alpha-beta hydrolase superfamily lysophospholipase
VMMVVVDRVRLSLTYFLHSFFSSFYLHSLTLHPYLPSLCFELMFYYMYRIKATGDIAKWGAHRHVYTWGPRESQKDAAHHGNIILFPGYGEPAARYQHVADQHYNPLGLKVWTLDHFGHGEDPMQESFYTMTKVPFEQLINDCVALCRHVAALHPDMPFMIHGHSMGGMLAINTTMRVQHDANFRASIFSASAIRVCGQGFVPKPCADWAFFRGLASGLDFLTNGSMPNPGAAANQCTSDPVVLEYCAANKDKVFGGDVTVGWGVTFMQAGDKTVSKLPNLKAPFICFHGVQDAVIPIKASEILMKESGTAPELKKMYSYEGKLHEVMNEDCKDEVCKTMAEYADKMCREDKVPIM